VTKDQSISVPVVLTDDEWGTVCGLLSAVIKMQELASVMNVQSALNLKDKAVVIKHAIDVIEGTVMSAYVEDVIAHFGEEPPGADEA
jgi:hypothetical protein